MQEQQISNVEPNEVTLPAPTAWPFTFALGLALILAGLLTSVSISILGAILYLTGAVSWFREIFPREHHVRVRVSPEEIQAVPARKEVIRLPAARRVERAWLPLKIYPVSAGVKGGLAGGVAMAVLAMVYGAIFFRSVWYPINLMAGSLYDAPAIPTLAELLRFHLGWFAFALAMHVTMCLLVGLLYGAMLPMLPTRPIVLGGIISPLLWTGLLYHILAYVNPLLDQRINWPWFAASQVAFGITAGLVVAKQDKVWTKENLPLAMRAGVEAPGIIEERDEDTRR
jgi:hypothetical protein